MPTGSPSAEHHFLSLAGEVAESFSFNRSLGQIYGFLFLSQEPQSAETIAKACCMSKGNAGLNLRTLEAWGAVRRIGIPGNRKDHYAANTDLSGLAMHRLQEGLRKRLKILQTRFKSLQGDPAWNEPSRGPAQARLREVETFLLHLERAVTLLKPMAKFL